MGIFDRKQKCSVDTMATVLCELSRIHGARMAETLERHGYEGKILYPLLYLYIHEFNFAIASAHMNRDKICPVITTARMTFEKNSASIIGENDVSILKECQGTIAEYLVGLLTDFYSNRISPKGFLDDIIRSIYEDVLGEEIIYDISMHLELTKELSESFEKTTKLVNHFKVK